MLGAPKKKSRGRKAVEIDMQALSTITGLTKNIERIVKSGARASLRLHVKYIVERKIRGQFPSYFDGPRNRTESHIRSIRRSQRVGYPRVTNGQVTTWFGSRKKYAGPIEDGGEYQQRVRTYRRAAPKRPIRTRDARGRARESRAIGGVTTVLNHRRMRKEVARHIVARTLQEMKPVAAIPVQRALTIYLKEGRDKFRSGELTGGLG